MKSEEVFLIFLFSFFISSIWANCEFCIDISNSNLNYELNLLDQQLIDSHRGKLRDFLSSFIFENNPYKNVCANVRISKNLCIEEENFLQNRKKETHKGLEKFIGIKISENEILRIAICFSGGGYRAMISSLGSLIGAEKIGLLDCLTYISSLSGSTWMLACLMAHKLSLIKLKKLMKFQTRMPINFGFDISYLIRKGIGGLFSGKKLTITGIWGTILGRHFFGEIEVQYADFDNSKKNISKSAIPKLSDQDKYLKNMNLPFPIYTAALVLEKDYDWIEFTPYEIGSTYNNTFVPSWSFGRKFRNGTSMNFTPEYGIDFFMGVWGSAFTASLKETLNWYGKKLPPILFHAFNFITGRTEFGKVRISPALIPNFAFKMPGHLWSQRHYLTLVDAGLDFNLPLPPLLKEERKVDIIIVCDMSAVLDNAPELQLAECYAIKNTLKFPKINYRGIEKSIINVFKDEIDPNVPIIIYMPLIKNEKYSSRFDPMESIKKRGYCSTFNLRYSPEQFDELCNLFEFNMVESGYIIKKTIKDFILKKRSV